MMDKRIQFGIILLIGIIFSLVFISATYISSNPQYTQFSAKTSVDKAQCEEGMDFVIQIAPFGCTPAVVRTDLLEENNVNVFCRLGATQINPLLDVETIESVSFDKSGISTQYIKDIGFHPAKAALGVKTDLNSPVLNNIGYVVITLKKQANASAVPDFVAGNLTAKIKYDVKNALGVGKGLFYLPEFDSRAEWEEKKSQYGFWNGRGYLRADSITSNDATISVHNVNSEIASVKLKKGEKSQKISIPGFECTANLELKLEGLESPVKRAQLRINAEVVEVAQSEYFLDNKCQVKSLDSAGIVKKISIRCREDLATNTFDLRISPNLTFKIDGVDRTAQIGDFLYNNENGGKGIYLGYIDSKGSSSNPEDLLVYLVAIPKEKFSGDDLTDNELSSLNFLGNLNKKAVSTSALDKFAAAIKEVAGEYIALERYIVGGREIYSLLYSEADTMIFDKRVSLTGFAEPVDVELTDTVKEYYDNAKADYETIRDSFSSEAYDSTSFGEEALFNEIILLSDAKQQRSVLDLCTEFEGSYPNSEKKLDESCKNKYKLSNQENAIHQVTINKVNKKIIFDDVYEPSFKEYGVRVRLDTKTGSEHYDLRINEIKYLDAVSKDFIQLVSVDDNSARIRTSLSASGVIEAIKKEFSSETIRLEKDVTRTFEEYSFTATEVNSKKLAKVSVIPGYESAGTEAKFGFKIGIEKRNFQLSPEKTKEKIDNLNKDISRWQNISNNIGNVTDGLKKACIATGLGLTLKNFLSNLGGAGIARQYVMRKSGGWFERCSNLVTPTYTLEKCYLDNSDEIDKEVEELSKIIEQQNTDSKKLEEGITTQKFLSDKVVNTKEFMKKYIPQVQDCLSELSETEIVDPSGKGDAISIEQILSDLEYEDWENGKFTKEQLRDIELFCLSKKVPELSEITEKGIYSNLLDVKTASAESNERESSLSKYGFKEGYFGSSSGKITEIPVSNVQTFSKVKSTFTGVTGMVENDDYVYYFKDKLDRKEYLLVLDDDYFVIQTYLITDIGFVPADADSTNPFIFGFKKYDASKYENKYTNAKLRYYETEPYKGMPAIVPFDLENGWYAYIKQTLPVLGSIRAYDASARLNSFSLCNVGENGLEENMAPDDICQTINTGTGQPYNVFHGLSEIEADKIIHKAEQAVEQAQRAYKSGLSGKVDILGEGIDVGSPAVDIPGLSCQDFMSPEDCLLLFNVCDPVICPSSRCNLGGTFAVQDVIQSGIIGSLVLCLPNAQDGIIVPVCLSGIKAGLDGLLSVLTATKDCLQESLDTGKMVGICDEIYSVYMCEFLWRQALPVADVVIPKIIEMVLGQNVRGGGEYLGVSNAWSAAEKSISYFTQYYGASATRAFKARTTEGVGTEICRMSVSGIVPDSGNLLDTLTRTDSPPQFHGRFDEIPFTSVTVPPISQYKVYYHIFAGKDSGVYYQVYLKGVAGSSYYQDTSDTLMIASGYAAVGGYASEAKDFTAPSGYKEMCINVNGQEECGFKEVSTSFALDYLEDKYAQEQANQTDIQTERECISGTASAYSLLNLNVQSAAEEIVNPAIYNEGIIRICATKEPGAGTDAYAGLVNSRWKQVGYCDTPDIKCWLDTESVKKVIKSTAIEGEVLGEINEDYLAVLKNEYGYLSEEEFASKIEEIKNPEIEQTKKIGLIEDIIGKVFHNSEKAELLLLRGDAYSVLMRVLLIKIEKEKEAKAGGTTTPQKATLSRSETGNILWKVAKKFADDGWDEFRIKSNGAKDFENVCTRFVMRCMREAGIEVEGVRLRDTWTEEENMDKLAIKLEASGKFLLITNPQNLKKGDIVMFGGKKDKTQHTGIFDSYSKDEKKIIIYDDYGTKKDEKIKIKKTEFTITGTWYFTKAYRYVGDLNEEEKAAEQKEAITGVVEGTEGEVAEGNILGDLEFKGTKAYIMWVWAQAYLNQKNDESKTVREGEKECLKFVDRTIKAAEIETQYLKSSANLKSIDTFVGNLEIDTNNFAEISPDNLIPGDIVILGIYCEKTQMIGIFNKYSGENLELVDLYANPRNTKTMLIDYPLSSNNWYVYKGFRYIGDLSEQGKADVRKTWGENRKKWTVTNALMFLDNVEVSDGLSSDFVSPIFEYNENRRPTGTLSNLYYKYEIVWEWSIDGKNWMSTGESFPAGGMKLSDENQDFVESLEGKSYKQGLERMIDRMTGEGRSRILKPSIRSDFVDIGYDKKIVLRYKGKTFYFRYLNDKWEWSPKTDLTIPSALTNALDGEDFYDGAGIIFSIKFAYGKYSDSETNRKFVDELLFDGLITSEECEEIRGINYRIDAAPREECEEPSRFANFILAVNRLFGRGKDINEILKFLPESETGVYAGVSCSPVGKTASCSEMANNCASNTVRDNTKSCRCEEVTSLVARWNCADCCRGVSGGAHGTTDGETSESETTPTTTPSTSAIDRIGFKVGNIIIYTVDVAKTGPVEIIVELSKDCASNRYEIWKNAFFDTKVASRSNLQDITTILNSISGEGKYHVDAYCLDANGKTISHLKSKDIAISRS